MATKYPDVLLAQGAPYQFAIEVYGVHQKVDFAIPHLRSNDNGLVGASKGGGGGMLRALGPLYTSSTSLPKWGTLARCR